MWRVAVILGSTVLLLAAVSAVPVTDSSTVPPISVPVVTKYMTTEVQTLGQDEPITMIGQLCASAKGMELQVTVMLNNNPDWDPTFGVLYYYVVDDPNKGSSAALCNNYPDGKPGANCTVKSWPSTGDIYIQGHAGQSAAVSYTLDAEITPKVKTQASNGQAGFKSRSLPLQKKTVWKLDSPPTNRTVYLSEIVTIFAAQALGYHKSALLAFTFCPNPRSGTHYQVETTTTATDGRSSYASYICDKLPCVVDGPYVIAHNGQQLPSNNLVTTTGTWKTLYALIVNWGGIWDPAKNEYMGHFVFDAHQK